MKDDVESLTYMLIHLGRGRLPWLYVDVKPGDNYINIFNCKRTIDPREMIGSLPTPFVKLVNYSRDLDCLGMPDYEYMRQIFYEVDESQNRNLGGHLAVNKSPSPGDPRDRESKKNLFIKAKSSNYQNRAVSQKKYSDYKDNRNSLHVPGNPVQNM